MFIQGPLTWHNLHSVAKTGKRQSPIDIKVDEATVDDALTTNRLR